MNSVDITQKHRIPRTPLTIIELIIAVVTIIGGLYILSPLVVLPAALSHAPLAVQEIGTKVGLCILGGSAIAAGAAGCYGIFAHRYKIRSAALLANIGIRLFAVIAGLYVQSFWSFAWLGPVTIILIAIVCYVVVRGVARVLK